jgi:hypothetical protein
MKMHLSVNADSASYSAISINWIRRNNGCANAHAVQISFRFEISLLVLTIARFEAARTKNLARYSTTFTVEHNHTNLN